MKREGRSYLWKEREREKEGGIANEIKANRTNERKDYGQNGR